jgi:hypothetical protein
MLIRVFVIAVMASVLMACGGGGGSPGSNLLKPNSNATDSSGATATTTATVSAGAAASIALAAGDKIDASDDIFYAKRFAATVADTNGVPVVGARVSLRVTYPGFYKGFFDRDPDYKVIAVFSSRCAGEDANNNDVLDVGLGEDVNGNGVLDPAKALVTAAIEGSNLTDTNGNVKILVRWPKAHAFWVEYRLNTTVNVTGTEGTSGFNLRTSYAVGDDELASTPFARSPYGANDASCTNTN